MKLSPPASSSDVDVARGIARRLSRLAAPADAEEAPLPPYAPFPGARPAAAPRAEARPSEPPPPAPRPAPPTTSENLRMARAAAAEQHRPPAVAKAAPAPPPPAPPPPPPLAAVEEEMGVLAEEEPAPPPPPRPPLKPAPAKPAPPQKAAPPRPAPPPPPPPPPAPLLEEMPEESEFAVDGEAEVAASTDAMPDMDVDFEAAARAAAEAVPDVEPEVEAPRSWADILQDCLYLARASGALLIDAQGEVAAHTGDWPSPGVEHIAARLVPAMDKALKAAPHRSVSVPIGNLHLTAWRVHGTDTMVTVGFVAESPLKAEVRPAIDTEVKRGMPA